MPSFPHLELPKRIDGLHKPRRQGGTREPNPLTLGYLNDRKTHGNNLLGNIDNLSQQWKSGIEQRAKLDLPDLPNPNVQPVFLQIDSNEFDIESLKTFGIEVIAEEEDGFIIGASSDNFKSLKEKVAKFIAEEGKYKNQASRLWKIVEGEQWRIDQILSDELREKWHLIQDGDELVVDVGIACYVRISDQPGKNKDETDEKFQQRLQRWRDRKEQTEIKRDEIAIKREDEFEKFVKDYQGEILGGYITFDDSFSCRIRISGKGLKDIVLNYQFLFEVTEYEPVVLQNTDAESLDSFVPELIAPPENSPKVCIIDSGIQEEHRLLTLAIDKSTSHSFIPGDTSTADIATNGGHGTKVAGAILYPHQIPRNGSYQLPYFIQNARVLANSNGAATLPRNLFPPKLMEEIVSQFEGTRIFNMSINSYSPCRLIHMSPWAASIDRLMHENKILFILSAGNISDGEGTVLNPGIKRHLGANRDYPSYLLEKSSRIGNPAQSSFGLTVGSICFDKFDDGLKESFGEKDDPSSFSRTGLGLWGTIKPDVVEYGGDFVKEKTTTPNISRESTISPELVRSTLNGGSDVGKDSVGTSFSAPRVSYIAARLQSIYPTESTNLYRTLIVQSARLPEKIFTEPTANHIRHYGYGIPNLQRATENSEKRITLIASGDLCAKQTYVYALKVPSQMRSPGDEYDILVEVTLAFTALPRRTRRGAHSYLSTWLNWESSKLNENYEQFSARVLKDLELDQEPPEDQDTIKWSIRENKEWSKIKDIRRQDSSLQKAWCVIKSNRLPEVLSLAVIGHCGWQADLNEKVPYSIAVSFEALNANINVYEMIRIENEIEISVEVEQEINTEIN